ncbi:hypothetical protein BV20DRAFT_920489, partial [Pilatotrama ljubarskyi]
FPPPPLSQDLNRTVIEGFVRDIQTDNFLESACAVCAQLTCIKDLLPIHEQMFDQSL